MAHPSTSKLFHAACLTTEEDAPISEDRFDRMMDALTAKRIGELQNIVMQESIKLIQGKLDVVFFDATTFHFCQEFDDDDFPLESVADSKKEKEAPRLPLDGLEEIQPLDAPKEEAQEEEPPEESTSLDAIGLR